MSELGPVEIRTATIEAVAYPDRTLDMIVVPYDEWVPVEWQGRVIEESVAPGAFGAIRNRARKFLVNMEHDPTRWIGTVLDLNPAHPTGLRATVKVRRSPEGDQALDDASDGLLGGSIGMAVAPGDEKIDGNRRRIHKAFLDHIALTATPAYVGAEILEVRSTHPTVTPPETSPTPNLDRVLAEMTEMGYRPRLT